MRKVGLFGFKSLTWIHGHLKLLAERGLSLKVETPRTWPSFDSDSNSLASTVLRGVKRWAMEIDHPVCLCSPFLKVILKQQK